MWCCGKQKLQEEATASGALETIAEEGAEAKDKRTSGQHKKNYTRTPDEPKKKQKKRKAKPMTSTSTITTTLSITSRNDHPGS